MSKDDKDLEEIWKLFQDSNEDVQKRRKGNNQNYSKRYKFE